MLGVTFPDVVREHYGDGSKFGADIAYIYRGRPLGIAHAIGLCRDFVGGDPFIAYLGDNMLQYGIKGYVENLLARDRPPSRPPYRSVCLA